MAIERIQVIYCDPHRSRGEDVEGMHHKINVDGELLKVDLCPACEDEYLASIRELVELVKKPKKKSATKKQGESEKIRAWAAQNGIEIAERGRIPAEVREQYRAATA